MLRISCQSVKLSSHHFKTTQQRPTTQLFKRNLSTKPPSSTTNNNGAKSTTPPTANVTSASQTAKVNKKSGFPVLPLVLIALPATILYLSYEAEVGENEYVKVVIDLPGVVQVTSFVREMYRNYGLVPEKSNNNTSKEQAQQTQHQPATTHAHLPTIKIPTEEEVDDAVEQVEKALAVEINKLLNEEAEEEQATARAAEQESEVERDLELARLEDVTGSEELLHEIEEQHLHDLAREEEEEETIKIIPVIEAEQSKPQEIHHQKKVSTPSQPVKDALPLTAAEIAFQQQTSHLNAAAASSSFLMNDFALQSAALRKELETRLLQDLSTLDTTQLRVRITQLTSELFDRSVYENLRVAQAIKAAEAEIAERYNVLLHQQRQELQQVVDKVLFEREKALAAGGEAMRVELEEKYRQQLETTIRAQAEGFNATLQKELAQQAETIQKELQSQLLQQVSSLRKSHNDHLVGKVQPALDNFQNDFKAINEVIDSTASAIQSTFHSHELSAAVLILEQLLSATATPTTSAARNKVQQELKTQINNIQTIIARQSSTDEAVILQAVLDTLPRSVFQTVSSSTTSAVVQDGVGGILSVPELQVRFQVVREELRKVALAPAAAPTVIGQLIGSTLAKISFSPKGYIQGPGLEETLARAAYHLERGHLQSTLSELKGIEGYGQVLMKDWVQLVEDRLVVDQALRVLKAHAILRHRSFVPQA